MYLVFFLQHYRIWFSADLGDYPPLIVCKMLTFLVNVLVPGIVLSSSFLTPGLPFNTLLSGTLIPEGSGQFIEGKGTLENFCLACVFPHLMTTLGPLSPFGKLLDGVN